MITKRLILGLSASLAAAGALWMYFSRDLTQRPLTVAISPYQDLAMLVNIHHLQLTEKYQTPIDIITIPWEETYPTILSARSPIDVAFSSFADYLARSTNVNRGSRDPLLFIHPAYIFRGGAFLSFRPNAVMLTRETLRDRDAVNRFLNQRIALQRSTLYEMIIAEMARSVGRGLESVNIVDVPFDAGFLAAVNGDVDVAAVGLTQLTEGLTRGGRVVLNMDQLGFADVTGFIVRQSVLEARRPEIENLIRMWFESVNYVFTDIDRNSRLSLEYLARHAATRYTLESYKTALSQEYLPRSLGEARREIIDGGGRYDVRQIYEVMSSFLSQAPGQARPPMPSFIRLD
jgi:hypothetical protein